MESASDRFRVLVGLTRVRNGERIVSSSFLAILIAVLLWQTQWIALRPGLAVLLFVQAAISLSLAYQNRRFSRAIVNWQTNAPDEPEISGWFDEQTRFVTRLALVENTGRFAGFGLLAYGFWISSHLLWLAIAIGLVYPTIVYFGITRKNQRRAQSELEQNRDKERMKVQSKRAG